MTRRERAIEAAARVRFLSGVQGKLSLPHVSYHYDEAARSNREWVKDQIFAMTAAITEYERVMSDPDEGAQ